MQRYVRWLIDFKKSVLGNLAIFTQIQEQLDAGQNVVLLANHQTEADPGELVWHVTAISAKTTGGRLAAQLAVK